MHGLLLCGDADVEGGALDIGGVDAVLVWGHSGHLAFEPALVLQAPGRGFLLGNEGRAVHGLLLGGGAHIQDSTLEDGGVDAEPAVVFHHFNSDFEYRPDIAAPIAFSFVSTCCTSEVGKRQANFPLACNAPNAIFRLSSLGK